MSVRRLTADAHSVLGGFNAVATAVNVTVNATDSNAQLMLDLPSNLTRSRPFTISGWAVDLGAPAGTGIDVYAHSTVTGTFPIARIVRVTVM
jgi:hypothetical protein